MALSEDERAYVIATAVEILRHHKRERLLQILADRLAAGDYPDEDERDLDHIAHAIASTIHSQLPE